MLIALLVIIYLSNIGIGLPTSLIGAAWPSMYDGLHVPVSHLGIISFIIMGCVVISGICSGSILKRFEMRVVSLFSILSISIGLLGFALSDTFIWLCIFALFVGFGMGLGNAVLNNYIALYFKAKHMNWLHCFWGLGAAAGPIILSYSMGYSDTWRSGFFIISGIEFCIVLLLIFALPLWKKTGQGAELTKDPEQIKFSEIFKLRGIKFSLLAFFFYCSIESSIGIWGSSFLVMVKSVSEELAARWISLYFFGITFGRLIAGFLTMKLKSYQVVRMGYIICALGIVAMLLPFGNVSCLIGFFLMGMGCAPIFPCLIHETPTCFGKKYAASVIGLQISSAYLGSTLMPPVFGQIASFSGYGAFPFFLGALLIGMVVMIERRKIKQHD